MTNAQNGLRFDVDTQYVSGCFDIPAHDTEGMNICYRNVSIRVPPNSQQCEQGKVSWMESQALKQFHSCFKAPTNDLEVLKL